MDYNQIAKDIIAELKTHKCTDTEISQRLGISRQAYLRRRDTNSLTTDDITNLSSWLIAGHGGGFYLNNHFGGFMTKAKDELKQALKKDFHKLYVKQFSTSWETERLVRDTEIEIMPFDNLEKLISAHTTAILDRVADEILMAERLAWSDEDGSHMDTTVFRNNMRVALSQIRKELL